MHYACRNLRFVGAILCGLGLAHVAMAVAGRVHAEDAYREIVDAPTGIRLTLSSELLAAETRTRWGTNWTSRDKAINLDTLAYPPDQDFRRLYDNLKAIRGRELEQDRLTEDSFTLAGRDQDGSRFHLEMRRQGPTIRGYSLVYAVNATRIAERLIERLGQHFVPFSEMAGRPSRDSQLSRIASKSNMEAVLPINPFTVQPNLDEIDKTGTIQFAPNGKYIAIGNGIQIKLWDIASGRPLRFLEHAAYFEQFAFIEQGEQILSVHKDGMARFWNPLTGRLLNEKKLDGIEPGSHIHAMSHRAERNIIVAASWNGPVVVWDYKTGRSLGQIAFDRSEKNPSSAGVAFSRDGNTLVAAGDATVRLFDAATAKPRRIISLRGDIKATQTGVIDDKFIIAKTRDRDCDSDLVLVMLGGSAPQYAPLDTAPGCRWKPNGSLDWAFGGIILAYNEANSLLYISRRGAEISKVLDLTAVNLGASSSLPLKDVKGSIAAVDSIGSFAAVEDGEGLRIVKLTDGRPVSLLKGGGITSVFPIASADARKVMMHHKEAGDEKFNTWPIDGVAPIFHHVRLPAGFSAYHSVPDALVVLGADGKGRFVVHSISTDSNIANFMVPGVEQVNLARLSPDGRYALLDVNLRKDHRGNRQLAGTVFLVDTVVGSVIHEFGERQKASPRFPYDIDAVRSFAFSNDGLAIALGWQDGAVEIWEIDPPHMIKRLNPIEDETSENQVRSVAISPDKKFVVGGNLNNGVFAWSLETGRLLWNLEGTTVAGHLFPGGLAISPDNRLVAAGPRQGAVSSGDVGHERRVQVWEMATGKRRFLLSGHEANVNALAFTGDGRWLVSGSNDGSIRYWDLRTGSLVATSAAAPDGRWVIITDKGFFAASANAGDLLSVVRGFEATSIEQIWQSLYAPDLVREYLAGDPNGEVKAAAAHADLQKILDSGPAPSVTIVRPASGTTSAKDLVDVEARIADMGKGIGRIEWRVNGVTAAVAAGPDHTMSRQLALDPGENVIDVVAYNAANLLASLPARTTIRLDGVTDEAKPKLHVLAIGINAYIDKGWTPPGKTRLLKFPPLNLAVKDATGLAAALKQAGAGQYSEVKVTQALDRDATLAGLETIIDRMATDIHPRDTFVLFAAAHGTSLNGRFYMIPQDYDGGANPAALQAHAIGPERLQDWVANRIKAKRAIVLLDTCESGALVGGYTRSRTDVPASEAAIGRLHEATGRPVLTAAAEGKPAFEGYQGHGVFTWALIDALRNGDRNANGTIELSELVAHVQDQVPKIAAKLNGRGRAAVAARGSADDRQSARFGSRGEDFAIVRRLQ